MMMSIPLVYLGSSLNSFAPARASLFSFVLSFWMHNRMERCSKIAFMHLAVHGLTNAS